MSDLWLHSSAWIDQKYSVEEIELPMTNCRMLKRKPSSALFHIYDKSI